MKKQKRHRLIRECLSGIDFDKAERMYASVGWGWGIEKKHVTQMMLYNAAFKYADKLIKDGGYLIASGGITVLWRKKQKLLQIFIGQRSEAWN